MSAFVYFITCLLFAMSLSDEEPVHHVQQDSQRGIQKIVVLDTERNSRRGSDILPLSIEAGASGNRNSDSLNKRQTASKQPVYQERPTTQNRATARTPPKTDKTHVRQDQKGSVNQEAPHPKETIKVQPKTNEFGLGSTLVLTVQDKSGQPTYVDQSQPHKLAKPLKYGSGEIDEEIKPVRQTKPSQSNNQREQNPSYGQYPGEDTEYGKNNRNTANYYTPTSAPSYQSYPNSYTEASEVEFTQSKPHYSQNSHNHQPADNAYVNLAPSPTPPANSYQPNQANGHQNAHYSGFPESNQDDKNGAQSRPLQFEEPRVFPASPCNLVFNYEGREPNLDFWNGDIYVSTEEVLIGMRLDITLDRPARLLANWVADVKTRDNIHFSILSLKKRLLPGPAETVKIQVKFHKDGPVPYVQSINLNGRRICPNKPLVAVAKPTTRIPTYENPGDILSRPTTKRPFNGNVEATPPSVQQQHRRTTYTPPKQGTTGPDPNPNHIAENAQGNRLPNTKLPTQVFPSEASPNIDLVCGKPSVQPRPLVTHGQMTARGQWPWHAAIYKNVGIDLSYICGGSLISAKHVITAAHCVTQTYDVKPLDASVLVVYLGKYHLKLWSEGGVQNKQVSSVQVHPNYNNTDFRADLAVLVLSSPVQFTDFIRPVCLWDSRKIDISEIENKEGTVLGWGFDEGKRLTEELMQAKMPVIRHETCLWSYPEFFPQFTSNLTYCAGFRNGTSVCNGDSGGGMVFPFPSDSGERWHLRGLVSISVSEKENRVCDTKHYVVFTDLAKFLNWLKKYV